MARSPDEMLREQNRRVPASRRPRTDVGARDAGDDALIRAFNAGPWPALAVPTPPPGLALIFAHLTGRALSDVELAAFERARAACGYLGCPPVPPMEIEQLDRSSVATGAEASVVARIMAPPTSTAWMDDFGDDPDL